MIDRNAVFELTKSILRCEAEHTVIAEKYRISADQLARLNRQLDALLAGGPVVEYGIPVPVESEESTATTVEELFGDVLAFAQGGPRTTIKQRIQKLVNESDRAWTNEEIATKFNVKIETVSSIVSRLVNVDKALQRPTPENRRQVCKIGWVAPVA